MYKNFEGDNSYRKWGTSLALVFIIAGLIVLIALIGTMQVAKNPDDRNYHPEKGRNMSRLFWIYLALILTVLAVSLAMVYLN